MGIIEKDKVVAEIVRLLGGLKYGYLQIIVQDSKVVQIDKLEKLRLYKKGGDLEEK